MVDQSLRAALAPVADAATLDILFGEDAEAIAALPAAVKAAIRERLKALKTIDPACGSGAFPMGLLNRMVGLLADLGEQNTYQSKLHLIEQGIYGVDIQPIAIQISKLRFFISLLCDQTPDPSRPNAGLDQLPNLETHLVIANSLIGFNDGENYIIPTHIQALREELKGIRAKYVQAHTRAEKLKFRARDRELRTQIQDHFRAMRLSGVDLLSAWNPYDPTVTSPFFDPQWMFGIDTFDIVIGNPPYFVIKSDTPRRDEYLRRFAMIRHGRTNIYQCFMGLFGALLSPSGVAAYIHPKTLLGDSYLSATRAWILKQFKDVEILNIVDRRTTFANVLQSVIVTIWKKEGSGNAKIRVVEDKETIEKSNELILPLSQVVTLDGRFLVADSPLPYSILQKVASMPARHCSFVTGKVQWDKMIDWLTDKPNGKAKRLLFGENVQRYAFRESRRRAPYSYITYPNIKSLSLPVIVAQRTTAVEQERRIVASLFIPHQFSYEMVGENSVIVTEMETVEEGYFFLGILNSRFMDYYFRLFNSNTHVASGELNRIPIPLLNSQEICDMVKIILEKRARGMDTEAEEREVDQVVYRLYGLTAEEIALVERSFERSGKQSGTAAQGVSVGADDEEDEEA